MKKTTLVRVTVKDKNKLLRISKRRKTSVSSVVERLLKNVR